MATECGSELAAVAFGKSCLLCGTDLELDWPDLSEVSPADVRNHAPGDWRRAANSGCPFCNIIIAVLADAERQHGCSVPDVYNILDYGNPDADYTVKGFQVFLGLNDSTGRYLLALEHVWMPLLVDPCHQKEFWGTITVYLDGPDIFKTRLKPFFEIPRHAGSAQALDNARDWLTTCQNEHPGCSTSRKSDEVPSTLPNASIRILQICDESLILIDMKPRETFPPYVALSHCWGSCPTMKTVSTNVMLRSLIGIKIHDLPLTFKDAVKMTRMLGFDYLWIDSLCIVQDSPIDWEEQSSLMASVYGNADLVLAASSASSTEDGFLKERKSYRESSLWLPSFRNQEHALTLRYRLLERKDNAPDPLDRRAWALQERLLARRYLAVGSHDTSWACMTSSACECEWWRVASIWRKEIINVEKLIQHTTEDLGLLWRNIVLTHYFGRGLTVPSDNLVALSAIASVFQKKLRSKYCAGIWQHDLIPSLLWECVHRSTGYASDDSAPSWSWASLPTLDFRASTFTGRHTRKAQASALETETTISTLNQFGSVCSGFIKLWGRLWRAEVTAGELASSRAHMLKVEGYFENMFSFWFDVSLIIEEVCLSDGSEEKSLRRVRREEVQDDFYIGNVQEGDKVSLFMVPLWKEYTTSGLILGRSPKDPTKFERIGVFYTRNLTAIDPPQHKEGGLDDRNEQELVIV